jgi:hypothetical protein
MRLAALLRRAVGCANLEVGVILLVTVRVIVGLFFRGVATHMHQRKRTVGMKVSYLEIRHDIPLLRKN